MQELLKMRKDVLLEHLSENYGFVMRRKSISKKKLIEIVEFIEKGNINCG